MSAIKWTKELLAECRNEKGVVFGMMSEAAREAIQYERQYSHSDIMDDLSGNWTKLARYPDINPESKCFNGRAYRLSPSYTPPELEEKPWVDVPVFRGGTGYYVFSCEKYQCDRTIECAAARQDFMGYVYADGMVTVSPRRDCFDCGIALAPVAVRFWMGGDK